MAAKVDETKCVGCEACTGACPVEAISMVDGKANVDEGKCIDCGACVGDAPRKRSLSNRISDSKKRSLFAGSVFFSYFHAICP